MKVVTVVGARPQFIKAAAVSRALAPHSIQEVLVHTGQHYDADMSDVFFEEMEIPKPAYYLGVGGGRHGSMTGRQLEKIEEVLLQEQPNYVLVFGDTNSTLAGALAAAKLHIPVAHVEAGLRSFNRKMPEEINRVLTDHMSGMLFAPTDVAVQNLSREGIAGNHVRLVGDVMLDATMFYKAKARKPDWFDDLKLRSDSFVLCTIHRAENTDSLSRLREIIQGLGDSSLPVVIPLHPRTRDALKVAQLTLPPNLRLVPPVGYLEMTWLEMACKGIATDSGGVQKESYFHGKPCVTLRDETEWIELVDAGHNVLVGAERARIAEAICQWQTEVAFDSALYGNGAASQLIAEALR